MYVSHQALRILGRDSMTAAEQREADEQLGRIVVGLSWSRRRSPDERARWRKRWLRPGPDRQAFER
jgi:hypothetical protein